MATAADGNGNVRKAPLCNIMMMLMMVYVCVCVYVCLYMNLNKDSTDEFTRTSFAILDSVCAYSRLLALSLAVDYTHAVLHAGNTEFAAHHRRRTAVMKRACMHIQLTFTRVHHANKRRNHRQHKVRVCRILAAACTVPRWPKIPSYSANDNGTNLTFVMFAC